MYTLIAAGDLMFQAPIVRSDNEPTSDILALFAEADHAFVNLEMVLTDGGDPADILVRLRGDPALAAELKRASIDVVTLANNHAFDFGLPGMRDTIAALDDAGVPHVGTGEDAANGLRPVTFDTGEFRVAFMGLASALAPAAAAGERRPGIAPVRAFTKYVVDHTTIQETPGVAPFVETTAVSEDVERACNAVAAARRRADIVVVGIHWGVPIGWAAAHQGELATYQQPLGRALVDAGADAIFGHHPHTLHGVEIYKDRPIFYSLGNFLFHALAQKIDVARRYPPYVWDTVTGEFARTGGLARLTWTGQGAPSTIELVPIWLNESGEPTPANESRARGAIDSVAALSEKFATVVTSEDRPEGLVATIRPAG